MILLQNASPFRENSNETRVGHHFKRDDQCGLKYTLESYGDLLKFHRQRGNLCLANSWSSDKSMLRKSKIDCYSKIVTDLADMPNKLLAFMWLILAGIYILWIWSKFMSVSFDKNMVRQFTYERSFSVVIRVSWSWKCGPEAEVSRMHGSADCLPGSDEQSWMPHFLMRSKYWTVEVTSTLVVIGCYIFWPKKSFNCANNNAKTRTIYVSLGRVETVICFGKLNEEVSFISQTHRTTELTNHRETHRTCRRVSVCLVWCELSPEHWSCCRSDPFGKNTCR